MQSETPRTIRTLADHARARALYWLAAGAQTIAAALDLRDSDELKTAAQFSLALALVLLASAGPEQSGFRRFIIGLALVIAVGLMLARLLLR